jgi:predicted permease
MTGILQDCTYGWRQLRKSPGFAIVAVASLALGIGANTAIFELVEAIRLRTLPVQNPRELVSIDFETGSMRAGWFSSRNARLTSAQFEEIRRQQQAFSGVMAFSGTRFNLSPSGEARYAEGLYVSGDFYRVLGVSPFAGRTISAEDDTPACPSPGAVLSYPFWQREFGGDPGVLGRDITLEGHAFPVIGITPASFFGVEVGNRYDVAIPTCADALMSDDGKGRAPLKHAYWLSMMGRLKPGWTEERATAHLHALSPGITRATVPPMYKSAMVEKFVANKIGASAGGTGISGLRRRYAQPLWVLLAATALVVLIACANLANLLLARASTREREIAVRLAIGASRWRLVRQLLIESSIIAFAGAVIGIALASALSRALVAFLTTENNTLFLGLALNWRVLGFTIGLAVVTCVLFGLAPAMRATHIAPASAIRSGGRSVTAGRERVSLRRLLVGTQVALSLVLLVGALLFVRSLRNLANADPGFAADGILSVSLDFARAKYPKERRPAIYRELYDRLSAVPGVASAAQVWFTPVSGSGWDNTIGPDNAPAAGSGKDSNFNRVGPGYFRTMGTALLAGRDFNNQDSLSGPKVAIVNETFARKFFGKPDVVGRTFHMEAEAGKPEDLIQIVGVVRNTKYYDLREDFVPIGFFPAAQEKDPGPDATFVLRVQGPIGDVMNGVKRAAAEVSPAMGLQFRPLSAQLQESILRERLMATLSGAFAFLAGALATLGLYGVISYMVARRRNEIGVRIALGADRGRIVRMVLRETILLLGFGLAAGLLLALWAGSATATMLFGLKPYDPASIGAAVALLGAVGICASYLPARRAAALEPMNALRDE